MATTTTNLGLTKPAGTDAVDIAVINANMDKIDTAVASSAGAYSLYNGNLAPGGSVTIENMSQYRVIVVTFSSNTPSSSFNCSTSFYYYTTLNYLPIVWGGTNTWVRLSVSGTTFEFLSSGNADVRIKTIYGITKL